MVRIGETPAVLCLTGHTFSLVSVFPCCHDSQLCLHWSGHSRLSSVLEPTRQTSSCMAVAFAQGLSLAWTEQPLHTTMMSTGLRSITCQPRCRWARRWGSP